MKDPLVGTIVDERFRILAGIGQGATSSVYKAEELANGQIVAVKILHAHLCTNDSLVARFEREAQAAKILVHPNIVAVNEYAVATNGTPYLVMDFVDGISLQQKLITNDSLSLAVALPIFIQVCAALNVAHQAGIIHRDLKPGNIILGTQPDGTRIVKILDFGCAMVMPLLGDTVLKVTQTGEMLGSLLYMSPEQCLDQDVDARSDCYSLACVMYETVTGKPPLSARTAFETMNKQLSVMPDSLARVRPDLVFPKQLEKIIFKAMAKSPAKRYQNVVDLMDDLLNISGEKTTSHQPQAVIAKALKPSIETRKLPTVTTGSFERKHPMKLILGTRLDDVWQTYYPFFFLVLIYFAITKYPLSLPIITVFFGYAVYRADRKQKIINLGEKPMLSKNALRHMTPRDKLVSFWKISWPYFFITLTYLSINYYPLLLPLIAISFGWRLHRSIVDDVEEFEDTSNAANKNAIIATPSDRRDWTYLLAHLAPLAKLDIVVHNARRAFTYTSGDALISMDISSSGGELQEIIVRPVFQRSFFWDTICEEQRNIEAAGEVFEVPAYITKSTDRNWNVLVIKGNQATIVEVVMTEEAQAAEAEDDTPTFL